MGCPKCGMEEDRDVIAVRNLLLKYNNTQIDVPASSVLGRTPPHEMGGEDPRLRKVNAGSERVDKFQFQKLNLYRVLGVFREFSEVLDKKVYLFKT
ncbi:MAG: hypothetical protein QW261_04950 [Candidatus Jordarchaeaceae archaeon]